MSNWANQGCPHDKRPRPSGGRPQTWFDLDEVGLWVKNKRRTISVGGDTRSYAARNGIDGRRKDSAVADLDRAREEAKLRKELAAAEKAELELEKMKGELISTADVNSRDLAKIARARAVLLGGPSVLAQDTIGDPEADEALIKGWVYRALDELSRDEDEEV